LLTRQHVLKNQHGVNLTPRGVGKAFGQSSRDGHLLTLCCHLRVVSAWILLPSTATRCLCIGPDAIYSQRWVQGHPMTTNRVDCQTKEGGRKGGMYCTYLGGAAASQVTLTRQTRHPPADVTYLLEARWSTGRGHPSFGGPAVNGRASFLRRPGGPQRQQQRQRQRRRGRPGAPGEAVGRESCGFPAGAARSGRLALRLWPFYTLRLGRGPF
jgi:hypothetical protein